MHVERGRRQRITAVWIIGVVVVIRIWIRWVDTGIMEEVRVNMRTLVHIKRTTGGCMICTGICGSGAGTGIVRVTTVHHRPRIQRVHRSVRAEWPAEAVGATTRRTAGRRIVTTSTPSTAATAWASAS